MGRAIYKLGDDAYVEWSSVVDAPVSTVHSQDSAVRTWGADRVRRANTRGHSYVDGYMGSRPLTPEDLIAANRAGPNEASLTLDEILRCYAEDES